MKEEEFTLRMIKHLDDNGESYSSSDIKYYWTQYQQDNNLFNFLTNPKGNN